MKSILILLGLLLIIVITVPLIAHYYISNMSVVEETVEPGWQKRTNLGHSAIENLEVQITDLK